MSYQKGDLQKAVGIPVPLDFNEGATLPTGITLQWEDQPMSSTLFVLYKGRVIGIRAVVTVRQWNKKFTGHVVQKTQWDIQDSFDLDTEAPKFLGPVGKTIGAPHLARDDAKFKVEQMIMNGMLKMDFKVED